LAHFFILKSYSAINNNLKPTAISQSEFFKTISIQLKNFYAVKSGNLISLVFSFANVTGDTKLGEVNDTYKSAIIEFEIPVRANSDNHNYRHILQIRNDGSVYILPSGSFTPSTVFYVNGCYMCRD